MSYAQFANILDIEPKPSGDKPFKKTDVLCIVNILDIEPKPSGGKPFKKTRWFDVLCAICQ
jgi:hypothetical protein